MHHGFLVRAVRDAQIRFGSRILSGVMDFSFGRNFLHVHDRKNVSPTALSFGNQNVGTTSKGAAFVLFNVGDAALTLASGAFAFTGPNAGDFAQTNNCGSSLGYALGSNSCTITVTFTPTQTGVETATLQITDNDDDTVGAKQYVTLTGSGLSTIPGTSLYTKALES